MVHGFVTGSEGAASQDVRVRGMVSRGARSSLPPSFFASTVRAKAREDLPGHR